MHACVCMHIHEYILVFAPLITYHKENKLRENAYFGLWVHCRYNTLWQKRMDGTTADSMRLSHHIPALDQKQCRGEPRLYKF